MLRVESLFQSRVGVRWERRTSPQPQHVHFLELFPFVTLGVLIALLIARHRFARFKTSFGTFEFLGIHQFQQILKFSFDFSLVITALTFESRLIL